MTSEWTLASSSCSFCSVSSSVSLACSFSMRDTVSPLFTSSLARWMLNFERISSVAFCSRVIRDCAVACSISASACFSSDCFSCIVRCRVEASNTTTTSPALTVDAVLRELDDLQVAGLHRRREHDRLERADVAADLDRVDELAAGDLRGRQIGHGGACARATKAAVMPSAIRRAATALFGRARRMPDRRAGAVIASPGPARWCAARRPRLRPGRRRRPLRARSSRPTVTVCSLTPLPRRTRTNTCSAVEPQRVPRHDEHARLRAAISTSSDAVRSGIRLGCAPSTAIRAMKVRTFGDSVGGDGQRRDLGDAAA